MKDQAIALCRVSTPEQKLNNSLSRQEKSVIEASYKLGVEIVKTFSGDASSKVGKNYKRPDLLAAFDIAKTSRSIKYLIVDEVDRFMRSTGEMFYWITKFQEEAGTKVYFASNPELNSDDARSRLLLSLDGYKAEGSNEERISKSINGHIQAIKDGRYTFHPKPGYIKGNSPGIHARDPLSFEPLQIAFREIISQEFTPTEVLKRLMQTSFATKYKRFNMDKFRACANDPYYAGIVEMDKQVKARNENGLHEKMLSIDEHERLKSIINGTYRPRGASKQYNPEFPMNKMLKCADCGSKFTGSRKTNGKYRENGVLRKHINSYYKYRCRGCKKEFHRSEVHENINSHIDSLQPMNHLQGFREALELVWHQRNTDKINQAKGLENRLDELNSVKSSLVRELALATPDMKPDIEAEISKLKAEIIELEQQIKNAEPLDEQLMDFVEYAMNYTNDLKDDWWNLDGDERKRCQQLLFTDGIYMDSQKKVSTPKISRFYRLKPNKKDLSKSEKSLLVELAGNAPASSG